MHVPCLIRSAAASSLAALLAGCAGGGLQTALPGSQIAPTQSLLQQSSVRAAATASDGFLRSVGPKTPLLYMSSWGTLSDVNVFTMDGKQVGHIINGLQADAPEGLFVDPKGNLWVAAGGVNNNVLVYPRGALSPSKVLVDPLGSPVDVAVCADGTAYVANGGNAADGNTASVQVYAPGRTKPTRTLTYAHDFRNPFLTCDAKGNVFVALQTALGGGNGRVIEFPEGKQAGVRDLGISLQLPEGIVADKAGNLLVSDYLAQTITAYTEGGAPTGHSVDAKTSIKGIALSSDGQKVIIAAPDLYEGIAFSFPAGKQERIYGCCSRISPPLQVNDGIAIDPGA